MATPAWYPGNNIRNYKHGARTRGQTATPEYTTWYGMRRRCRSQEGYVKKGITVCARWDSFDNFLSDMGPKPSSRHSIDRINNDGDYTPENCRWATPREQLHNSRRFGIEENHKCLPSELT